MEPVLRSSHPASWMVGGGMCFSPLRALLPAGSQLRVLGLDPNSSDPGKETVTRTDLAEVSWGSPALGGRCRSLSVPLGSGNGQCRVPPLAGPQGAGCCGSAGVRRGTEGPE